MQENTPFFIASIDKLITAVVVMKLHEQDKLDLRAPISTYLPAELLSGLHTVDDQDRTGEITVTHLLSHTSGLASYVEDRPKGGNSLFESIVSEKDRSVSLEEAARIIREDLKPHFPPQPLDDPRPRIRYSDTNFALLRGIIRNVTGRPLPETFKTMVFEPIGLAQTWMVEHNPAQNGMNSPATVWAGDNPLDIPAALASLDAIYSTVHDLNQFMRALSTGQLFESSATFELMQARWTRFGFPRDPAAARAPSWPIEYGLGIKRLQLPRLLTGFRRLPAVFGHSGSTGTWAFVCPDLDVVISGALNQTSAGALPYRLLPRILTTLVR